MSNGVCWHPFQPSALRSCTSMLLVHYSLTHVTQFWKIACRCIHVGKLEMHVAYDVWIVSSRTSHEPTNPRCIPVHLMACGKNPLNLNVLRIYGSIIPHSMERTISIETKKHTDDTLAAIQACIFNANPGPGNVRLSSIFTAMIFMKFGNNFF